MEVIVQQWPQIILHTHDTPSLSQSEAHCTDVTVDEWTNSQSQYLRPAGYVASVPVMWHVIVIFFSSTVILSPSGQFFSCVPIAFSERYVRTTLYFYPCLQFLQSAAC